MFRNSPLYKKIQSISQLVSWNLFLMMFATIVLDDLASLLISDSKMFQFYAALYSFESLSLVWYIFNVIQVLLNALILIPFTFYIYNKNLPFLSLWVWILIGKLFFDISGHYYQFLDLKSLFYIKPIYGIFGIAAQLIIWIPSYVATINLTVKKQHLDLSQ